MIETCRKKWGMFWNFAAQYPLGRSLCSRAVYDSSLAVFQVSCGSCKQDLSHPLVKREIRGVRIQGLAIENPNVPSYNSIASRQREGLLESFNSTVLLLEEIYMFVTKDSVVIFVFRSYDVTKTAMFDVQS